jgi:hypothetical protein
MRIQKLGLIFGTVALTSFVACKERRYEEKSEYAVENEYVPGQAPSGSAHETSQNLPATGSTGDADRYGVTGGQDHLGTPGAVNPTGGVTGPGAQATGKPLAQHELDDARSVYNVDVASADAIARFTSSGNDAMRGIAAVDGMELTVAVNDAKPGRYAVHISERPSCDSQGPMTSAPGAASTRTAQNVPGVNPGGTGGAVDNLGPAGTGTVDIGRGDHVIGFLDVGSDGRGRLEATVSGELIAKSKLENQSIVIKSQETGASVSGELRGSVACGEIELSEQGA